MGLKTKALRSIAILTLSIGCLAGGLLTGCQKDDPDRAGVSGKIVSSGTADIGGDFTLIDVNGATVTQDILLEKPHLIYFGFAYCPDVCPTALSKLGAAQTLMGDRSDDVGFVLITIDPKRDTPEALSEYVTFDPFPRGLIGLTGSEAQVDVVKAAYKVAATPVMDDGSPVPEGSLDYTVDHSDIVYLMGTDGKFVDFFSARSTPHDISIRVRDLLAKGK